ncbi:MAG: FAD-dependent oxidoreductase, partial [Victivallaceae bacterium]|nr:FAD-dependent oxidoreductase [Victivallaceae bacterium]
KQFIGASGSALLARRAGLKCFDRENFLSLWDLEMAGNQPKMSYGAVYGNGVPTGEFSDAELAGVGLDLTKLARLTQRGLSGRQVSEYLATTRRYLRGKLAYSYKNGKSRHDCYPITLPSMPQYRKLYAPETEYVMRDNENDIHVADSIGLAADWRKSGPVWEIPFRAMYSKAMKSLLFAGRCIGSAGDAWEITRVIPAAAVTGQAAGMAAALCIDGQCEADALDLKLLQRELEKQNVVVHQKDLENKNC